MANFNVKESLGTSYIYCSKNAVDDVAASNFFGKAAAWVSGAAVVINQRVTSAGIQYYNKTGTNTTTAPASDTTNWGFDKANYQAYNAAQTYNIGDKCSNTTHHWVCAVNGTTGTFNAANWTDTIISNSSAPYKLENTAIVMMNADARFVSSEVLDVVNNIGTQLIWIILSNGVWNESLTSPTKFIRVVGQSNQKTISSSAGYLSNTFYDTVYFSVQSIANTVNGSIKSTNCFYNTILLVNNNPNDFTFSYKNIFYTCNFNTSNILGIVKHIVSCTFINCTANSSNGYYYYVGSIIRNNYWKGSWTFGVLNGATGLSIIAVGSFDYNCFDGNPTVAGVSQTSLSMLKTTVPNQNNNSIYSTITLNADYTLQAGSVLVGAGSNGNNIGAEGVGYVKTNSDVWDSANGAVYKNITKNGTTLIRDQISKLAQAGGASTITLISTASATDSIYNGFRIYISSGTGVGQTRTISSYVGSTKVATVSVAWTTQPDSTSLYEILDGSVISAIGDLGSIMTIKKFNFNTSNVYDATGYIINQSVSETDSRNDSPSALTFDLKANNDSGLSGAVTRRFVFDDYLKIDSSDKGCGDVAFNPATLVSNTLTFRYYQVTLNFQK